VEAIEQKDIDETVKMLAAQVKEELENEQTEVVPAPTGIEKKIIKENMNYNKDLEKKEEEVTTEEDDSENMAMVLEEQDTLNASLRPETSKPGELTDEKDDSADMEDTSEEQAGLVLLEHNNA
jgi:hypothetical protein